MTPEQRLAVRCTNNRVAQTERAHSAFMEALAREPPRENVLSDEDVERIARRVAEILRNG